MTQMPMPVSRKSRLLFALSIALGLGATTLARAEVLAEKFCDDKSYYPSLSQYFDAALASRPPTSGSDMPDQVADHQGETLGLMKEAFEGAPAERVTALCKKAKKTGGPEGAKEFLGGYREACATDCKATLTALANDQNHSGEYAARYDRDLPEGCSMPTSKSDYTTKCKHRVGEVIRTKDGHPVASSLLEGCAYACGALHDRMKRVNSQSKIDDKACEARGKQTAAGGPAIPGSKPKSNVGENVGQSVGGEAPNAGSATVKPRVGANGAPIID